MFRLKLDRFELDGKGAIQLMKSGPMQGVLRSKAQAVASTAGPGNRVVSDVGARRARAAVVTATFEARWNNARNHTLLRGLGSARG